MRRDTWEEEAEAVKRIMKRIPEEVTGEVYEVDAKLIGGTK